MTQRTGVLLLSLLLTAAWAAAPAEEPPTEGSGETSVGLLSGGLRSYERYCKNCHGKEGTGDGHVAKYLTVQPADLTQISERHDGTFPVEELRRVIDGRELVRAHGRREMPLWGDVFGQRDPEDAEGRSVERRIDELIEYLRLLDGRVLPAPAEPPGAGR